MLQSAKTGSMAELGPGEKKTNILINRTRMQSLITLLLLLRLQKKPVWTWMFPASAEAGRIF